MSMYQPPEVIGEGLLIPRVTPELRQTPLFNGMGVLVGQGASPDTLSVVVTGKRNIVSYLLDHEYKPASRGLVDFRLEGSGLVAHRPGADPYDRKRYSRVELGTWPLSIGHEIPAKHADSRNVGLTEIEFSSLSPFFEAEHERYEADRVVRESGIAVYGLQLYYSSLYGGRRRSRYAEYHDGSVLVAATKTGELAVLRLGQRGAMQHVLKDGGKKLTRGYHDFVVENGKVRGKISERLTRRTQTRLSSRHIPKIPLARTAEA